MIEDSKNEKRLSINIVSHGNFSNLKNVANWLSLILLLYTVFRILPREKLRNFVFFSKFLEEFLTNKIALRKDNEAKDFIFPV